MPAPPTQFNSNGSWSNDEEAEAEKKESEDSEQHILRSGTETIEIETPDFEDVFTDLAKPGWGHTTGAPTVESYDGEAEEAHLCCSECDERIAWVMGDSPSNPSGGVCGCRETPSGWTAEEL